MTYSRFFLPLISVWLCTTSLSAQGSGPVFPGLTGQSLLDSLFSHYRPEVVLSYADARDTLYAKVLAIDDDSLRCIYSGHALYLDPTQDPTQYVYLDGMSNGMNAEHSYPQSKGATQGTNAHSDMHHLYATRIPVNEARGDSPFGEIPDAQTQKWFIRNQVSTTIPAQNKDLYAEYRTTVFEPRESVKGNLARSVFYFYTMYRNQANTADPNFFEIQRPILCQWNQQDPADSAELVKTWRIAAYQNGKPNPFVLDCSLAYRTWCPEVPPTSCATSRTEEANSQAALGLRITPNPVTDMARLEMTLPFAGALRGRVLSVLGQELAVFETAEVPSGGFSLPLDVSALGRPGGWLGFVEVEVIAGGRRAVQVVPMVVW